MSNDLGHVCRFFFFGKFKSNFRTSKTNFNVWYNFFFKKKITFNKITHLIIDFEKQQEMNIFSKSDFENQFYIQYNFIYILTYIIKF